MLLVALGAPFGAMLRYFISRRLNHSFPYGTLIINLLGSFLLGLVARYDIPMLLFGTGFLGAFTTYSTFNVEVVQLFYRHKLLGLSYLLMTYIAGPLLFIIAFTFQN